MANAGTVSRKACATRLWRVQYASDAIANPGDSGQSQVGLYGVCPVRTAPRTGHLLRRFSSWSLLRTVWSLIYTGRPPEVNLQRSRSFVAAPQRNWWADVQRVRPWPGHLTYPSGVWERFYNRESPLWLTPKLLHCIGWTHPAMALFTTPSSDSFLAAYNRAWTFTNIRL